jgi:hypothetical protein
MPVAPIRAGHNLCCQVGCVFPCHCLCRPFP